MLGNLIQICVKIHFTQIMFHQETNFHDYDDGSRWVNNDNGSWYFSIGLMNTILKGKILERVKFVF